MTSIAGLSHLDGGWTRAGFGDSTWLHGGYEVKIVFNIEDDLAARVGNGVDFV